MNHISCYCYYEEGDCVCRYSSHGIFYVSCLLYGYENFQYYLSLERELTAEDSGNELVVRAEIDSDQNTEELTKVINVIG